MNNLDMLTKILNTCIKSWHDSGKRLSGKYSRCETRFLVFVDGNVQCRIIFSEGRSWVFLNIKPATCPKGEGCSVDGREYQIS